MRAVIHDFRERLDWSNELSDEAAWVSFYRGLWPGMVSAVRVDANCPAQRSGVDRLLYLPDNRTVRIDEKKREKDYGDFLAEVVSVAHRYDPAAKRYARDGRDKPGWCIDSKNVSIPWDVLFRDLRATMHCAWDGGDLVLPDGRVDGGQVTFDWSEE